MQKSELEKIKRKAIDEWVKMDIDCEEECVCDVAVEIAIRKTAERIFKELEKIEKEYWQEYCTQSDRIGVYIQARAIEKAIKKLRKEFLGDSDAKKRA